MQAWGLTDPGCVRVQNQDAYGVHTFEEDSLLCTVCDGMGGAKSGNVASSLALQIFMQEVTRLRKPGDEPGAGRADVPGSGASGQFYRL